jgi:hypothetical protein
VSEKRLVIGGLAVLSAAAGLVSTLTGEYFAAIGLFVSSLILALHLGGR